MRRTLFIGGASYLALAALGHYKEHAGSLTCECQPGCWCQRSGVRLFRWVFPFKHSFGDVPRR